MAFFTISEPQDLFAFLDAMRISIFFVIQAA